MPETLVLTRGDVAQLLGVHVTTVTNWEVGRGEPAGRHMPGLIDFLGCGPANASEDSLPTPQQLKAYGPLHGLSEKRLAAVWGADPSTSCLWNERRASQLSGGSRGKPGSDLRLPQV